MGNIHLVTGFAGHQHITSADQAAFNSLMFGGGQYVLAKGNRFAASVVTNNQVNVLDGDIYMQGRHIRLNEATSVDLTIENGTQGALRNDLIVVRYTKDENTGIEDANLVVIKGTAAASNPADPAYTSGDLVNGNAILNDMPMYRVQLDGLNISELVPLFEAVDINFISHANRHASDGADPITPAMIGAATEEHTHTAADVGGVSSTGGNMTGDLTIEKANPLYSLKDTTSGSAVRFLLSGNTFALQNFNVAGNNANRRHLNLGNSAAQADIANALMLIDVVNGQATPYPILHTGNINSLYPAANVVTGSYVGTGTSGSAYRNSVVLPGEPALFIVGRKYGSGVPNEYCAIRLHSSTTLTPVLMAEFSQNNVCRAMWNEDSSALEWYAPSDTAWQMNHTAQEYVYMAIY